ncbi:MAG TPA: CarD family transcriptional regulator, partial [Sulfurovum sp.]|nr:CarD family transcriptional regulator [Sulfurovum sp.]
MMYQSNIYEYLETLKVAKLLICKDDKEAFQIRDVAALLGFEAYVLPDIRASLGEDLRTFDEEIHTFLSTLSAYHRSTSKKLLISPLRTILIPFPNPELLGQKTIEFGDKIDLQTLKNTLYHWGYHFTDIAASKGEVSIRGDIIDIFPIDANKPYRIGLFDDEVETIQYYDEATQKRIMPKEGEDELDHVTFTPAFLSLEQEAYEALTQRVEKSKFDCFVKDIDALGLWCLEELGSSALGQFEGVFASAIQAELEEVYALTLPLVARETLELAVIPSSKRYRDLEVVDPNKLLEQHKDKKITIIARNESIVRGSHLESFEGIEFVYQEGIVNILGADRLILSLNKPLKRKKVKKASIILDELKPGDYVVHENHGVGIFKGIEKREVLGATSEFVVMSYQNGDLLLIPVSSLEVIDRFVADSGT